MTSAGRCVAGPLVFDPDMPVAHEAQRACSVVSRASGESLTGWTPPRPQPWLIIEDDGPWGAVPAGRDPRLPEPFRRALHERDIRLQLVRRPDRRHPGADDATGTFVALAWSDRQRSWVETTRLTAPYEQLGSGVLDALAAGERPEVGGEPVAPLVLVCTHGRVDPCCARSGRPVAAALADAYGPMVWETTHVGGCRFAANILLLPDGVMYGHTDPDRAVRQVGVHLTGRLLDDTGLRGQAGVPHVAQVAELAVRRATDTWDLHGVVTTSIQDDGDVQQVTVDAVGRMFVATVTTQAHPERFYGCGNADRWRPEDRVVTDVRRA